MSLYMADPTGVLRAINITRPRGAVIVNKCYPFCADPSRFVGSMMLTVSKTQQQLDINEFIVIHFVVIFIYIKMHAVKILKVTLT